MIRLVVFLALGLLPLGASAQDAGGAVAQLLKAADAECRAEGALGDTPSPPPQLEIGPAAVTWLDLDGDELKDDAIVDFNEVFCPLAYTLWSGSGGALIHLVLDDATSATWSGGYWQILTFRQSPVVLIGRHGSYCDSYGAAHCIQAITAADGEFLTATSIAGPIDWP